MPALPNQLPRCQLMIHNQDSSKQLCVSTSTSTTNPNPLAIATREFYHALDTI